MTDQARHTSFVLSMVRREARLLHHSPAKRMHGPASSHIPHALPTVGCSYDQRHALPPCSLCCEHWIWGGSWFWLSGDLPTVDSRWLATDVLFVRRTTYMTAATNMISVEASCGIP